MLTENGVFVGLWWTDLLPNAPNVSTAYIILCLEICFSLVSPFLLIIYYSNYRQALCKIFPVIDVENERRQRQDFRVEMPSNHENIPTNYSIDDSISDRQITNHQQQNEESSLEAASSMPELSLFNTGFRKGLMFCVFNSYLITILQDIVLAYSLYMKARNGIDHHFYYWCFGLIVGSLTAPFFISTLMNIWKRHQEDQSAKKEWIRLPIYIRSLNVICTTLLHNNLGRYTYLFY